MLKCNENIRKTKMQFKVPQDVQREDQIIGPLTLRQLVIVAVGGGIAYMLYVQLSVSYITVVWLLPVTIISALTIALAFLKIHGLPFIEFLMCFIEYNFLPKKRIWIQKTGNPYMATDIKSNLKKKKVRKKTKVDQKNKKTINDLVKILDHKNNK